MIDPRTPIIVGGGQYTQHTVREARIKEGLSPIGLLERAAWHAADDAHGGDKILREVDTLTVVQFTADAPGEQGRLPRRLYRNPPLSLAHRIGAKPRRMFYTSTGGNTPQWLVNRTAEEIANGECDAALLVGAEYIATMIAALKQGIDLGWAKGEDGNPGSDPEIIGDARPGTSAYEDAYGLRFPVNTYPLFENAVRGKKGHDPASHLKWLGEFFSPFTKIAADNPFAWFRIYRPPGVISTPTPQNRMVGFPYTKYLNAVIEVDMAAAVLMTSVAKARELGIHEKKWIFLHGCADASDIWNVTERIDFHSSPAIRAVGKRAFDMAGIAPKDLSFVDLYSCFPSAVQIACMELGIAENDQRGLTVTGGLPYFGGPGNNYTMHSIVTMLEKLRHNREAYALCTANGWYVTKHSAGIYSARPVLGKWQRENPSIAQRELDAMPHPEVTETPAGNATVETYTVVTDRKGKRFGIIVGRDAQNRRFLAQPPDDDASLDRMMREEMLGRGGEVVREGERNIFRFAR